MPGNLPNRIPTHHDLMHRIPLELVAVITCPDVGLLASKLGSNASTNLAAPQFVVGFGPTLKLLRSQRNMVWINKATIEI
jgi:hypothetical protein